MATYFVTGASGALASRVIPLLAARPDTERVIGVDKRPLSVSSPKLQFIQVSSVAESSQLDPSQLDEVISLVEQADVVLHMASSSPPALLSQLLASVERSRVQQLVMISSATVFGAWPTNPVPIAEDAPLRPNPGFTYATRLVEAERLLGEWKAQHTDVATAVLRMSMILGGGLERALSAALGGVQTHREMNSSRPVQFLHIDDAVSAIMLVLEQHLDGVFNVAPKGFVGDATARAVAGTAPRPGLPRQVAWLANDVLFRKKYRANYAVTEPYLRHPWVISSDRLQAAGWQPSYTSEEALVAEAKPSWWGGLRPGQRRSMISGSVTAGSVATLAGISATLAFLVRRYFFKHKK